MLGVIYMDKLIKNIVSTLQENTTNFIPPLVDQVMVEFGCDPFFILISCLLSLRAKDSTTIHVCRDLFSNVKTFQQLLDVPLYKLEKIIFKTGFYKNKARTLHFVSYEIIKKFNSIVPDNFDDLIAIKGIGPKTANLVLGLAFGKPAICVDTHVHRISNRLGLITTKTPETTEVALQKLLPKKYWIEWNKLLVVWGQNICTPLRPRCNQCAIFSFCKRVGVKSFR